MYELQVEVIKVKIGIITLYGNNNFGNKLQNYALQEYLSKIDHRITVKTLKNDDLRLRTKVKRFIKRSIKKESLDERTKNFLKFNENINYDERMYNMFNPRVDDYDLLVFGSDQIWNCDFEGKTKLFIGDFSYNIKKISYAASFGKSHVDKKYLKKYYNSLSKFSNISVREEIGIKIVKNINANLCPLVHIDPTMLLTEEEWKVIIKKPDNYNNEKYILNYFLGELTKEKMQEIEKVAKENNCELVNILDKNCRYYNAGPAEFLYLIKNAFLICTDSFHSSVFSIIFNKPFVVFERNQANVGTMNSRIDTLLNTFKLKDRKYKGNVITKENINHDYSKAYIILKNERIKAQKYIEGCIKE